MDINNTSSYLLLSWVYQCKWNAIFSLLVSCLLTGPRLSSAPPSVLGSFLFLEVNHSFSLSKVPVLLLLVHLTCNFPCITLSHQSSEGYWSNFCLVSGMVFLRLIWVWQISNKHPFSTSVDNFFLHLKNWNIIYFLFLLSRSNTYHYWLIKSLDIQDVCH